jgi:hypothetical protein
MRKLFDLNDNTDIPFGVHYRDWLLYKRNLAQVLSSSRSTVSSHKLVYPVVAEYDRTHVYALGFAWSASRSELMIRPIMQIDHRPKHTLRVLWNHPIRVDSAVVDALAPKKAGTSRPATGRRKRDIRPGGV